MRLQKKKKEIPENADFFLGGEGHRFLWGESWESGPINAQGKKKISPVQNGIH